MLNGVLQGEDTTLALGFITNVGVLLTHTDHHTLVAGAADDGGEDGTRGVVAGEASLDHAGAIVAHERYRIFIVAHGGGWSVGLAYLYEFLKLQEYVNSNCYTIPLSRRFHAFPLHSCTE